jgi:hypothetical protein
MLNQEYKKLVLKNIIPVLFILLGFGCKGSVLLEPPSPPSPKSPELLGYSIQTGAFSVLANAVRMTDKLRNQGCDVFYFRDESGLFKVRIGDFVTFGKAEESAKWLLQKGLITDYFIVVPADFPEATKKTRKTFSFRDKLVTTAEGFLDYPYIWGGESPDEGFDCSGLALAVYRLNGLNLPRTSREQYRVGNPVPRNLLKKGDLVFFDTVKGFRISHVGIYAGNGRFIHAPGRNKSIRYDSLANSYYSRCFVGGCTYF